MREKQILLSVAISYCCLFPAVAEVGSGGAGPRPLKVTWLDTGASTAVALETPSGKLFLIDTGGPSAGPGKIDPFLKSRGCSRIDGILISHPHSDHHGGALWLVDHWPVLSLYDHGLTNHVPPGIRTVPDEYLALRNPAKRKTWSYRVVSAGDVLDWDAELKVEVLAPVPINTMAYPTDPKQEHSFLNNTSIALRVQHGKNVFIFPGDNYNPPRSIASEKIKGTVLTSPHHGFHLSQWTRAASPSVDVVTCSPYYANNEGTPYTRYPGFYQIQMDGALGIATYVTAYDGKVTATSDGEKVVMSAEHERVLAPPTHPREPEIGGMLPSLSTNQAFTLTLSGSRSNYAFISSQGPAGPFHQFSWISPTNLTIDRTTTLWYFDCDHIGTYSTMRTVTYTVK